MLLYLGAAAVSMLGAALQACIGFGYGVIVMAFLPLLMGSIPSAGAVTSLASVVMTAAIVLQHHKGKLRFRLLLPVVLGFFLIMPLGSYLMVRLPVQQLRLFLGIMFVLLGLYYLCRASERVHISYTWPVGMAMGGLGGLFNGMFSMGGPPVAIYMLGATQDKDEYIRHMQAYFLISNCYASAIRVANGVLTADLLPYALALIVGVAGGLLIARKLYDKLNWMRLKTGVYLFIAAIGVYMVAVNLLT